MIQQFYNSINFYKNALDGTWARNKAISSNMTNVNTPNYKRKYVTFEDQLRSKVESEKDLSLRATDSKHITKNMENFRPLTFTDRSGSYRLDGNNVNIDTESAESAKNAIMYDAISRHVSGEFEKIKSVITEGSK